MTQAQVDQEGFFKKIDINIDSEYFVRIESGPCIGIFHRTKSSIRGIRLSPEKWAKLKELGDAVDTAMTLVPRRKQKRKPSTPMDQSS